MQILIARYIFFIKQKCYPYLMSFKKAKNKKEMENLGRLSWEIAKIIAKSKGFTIKWKKETKQVTGYQISYATNKNLAPKATKTKMISNAKATTKTISKLKAKKKYYVRVCTYKTVKVNGKMTKLYSNWSKVKTVTTKK